MRRGAMPAQQRAGARGQRSSSAEQRVRGAGGRRQRSTLQTVIDLPSSSPGSEKRKKILVAAHYVRILQTPG